jgi:DNA polymerase III delta prime subunit
MLPKIIIANDEKKITEFIDQFQKKNNIKRIITVEPQGKQILINQIREINKALIFKDINKIAVIIYRFDLANNEAQNAFLKTLEEKSENKLIILTVENINKLLPTIISRCQIINMNQSLLNDKKKLSNTEIEEILNNVKNNSNLEFLNHNLLNNLNYETAQSLINTIILITKRELSKKDIISINIIKEGIKIKELIKNNNINPQLAIDNYLIFINKMYNKNRWKKN